MVGGFNIPQLGIGEGLRDYFWTFTSLMKQSIKFQNLLRAVESSKASARDTSRSAQVEARLRTTISSLRDERDKAQIENTDHRRKNSLLEEELRSTKANLSRITQEKISMERDSRAGE